MLAVTGSLFALYFGAELFGRAAVITTAMALSAAAKLTLWTARAGAERSIVGLRHAVRLAANYLEANEPKYIQWSEEKKEVTVKDWQGSTG